MVGTIFVDPPCTSSPPGMVSWWAAENNAADAIGSNSGALQGGATFTAGRARQGFDFDGNNQYVLLSDNTTLRQQTFTVDAWVFPRTPGSTNDARGGVILAKDLGGATGANVSYALFGLGNTARFTASVFFTDSTGATVVSSDMFNFNNWHHVAMTWDGTTLALYVDGLAEGSVGAAGHTIAYTNDNAGIGRHSHPDRSYNGVIDEVDLFNRALTLAEIQTIYTVGSSGKCRPALQMSAASSRKTHGVAGIFDINMPLTNPAGVECRGGGATGDHTLVFRFSNTILGGNAAVTAGTGSVSGIPTFDNNTMTVNLTGVNNAQTVAVSLSNVADAFAQVLPGTVVNSSFLLGDTNGDRSVNAGDALQTRSRSGQGTDSTNFRSDVNADGSVNSGDTIAVRSRSGTFLP